MIYRMHPNISKYYRLHLDGNEAREALGEDTDFYMDERRISYINEWKPTKVDFYDAFGGGKKAIPDMSSRVGKFFLSEKSYNVLKHIIQNDGEFLPVTYEGGAGCIFNCLTVADELSTANKDLSFNDPLNDRFSIVFDESKIKDCNIFKTEIDFDGLFCKSELKSLIEKHELTGITFTENAGNPFSDELNMKNIY